MKTVNVTEFKANSSTILSAMEKHGEPITLTRRGVPVAELRPAKKKTSKKRPYKFPFGALEGKVEIVGDIIDTSYLWQPNRR
jgi:prevent-host-death family protein